MSQTVKLKLALALALARAALAPDTSVAASFQQTDQLESTVA